MARKYTQGNFKMKNPKKYLGDPTNVVFRSSWELHFMRYCDLNNAVVSWSSEETIVPYYFDVDAKMHRYYVDFLINVRLPNGSIETVLIEIKPRAEVLKPVFKRKNKSNEERAFTWLKNQAKWNAAEEYANKRGWKFRVLTEFDLGIRK